MSEPRGYITEDDIVEGAGFKRPEQHRERGSMSETTQARYAREVDSLGDQLARMERRLARAWEEGWAAAQRSLITAPYPEDNPYRLPSLAPTSRVGDDTEETT